MIRRVLFVLVLAASLAPAGRAQDAHTFAVAAVKYGGGGDWYQGQSPLPTFLSFVREHTLIDVSPQPDVVELTSNKVFGYPFLFLSGHGNVVFTDAEADRLRRYLEGGGFLYIDDDYGLDKYIRREMKKVFPAQDFVELPFDHPIYHTQFEFTAGPPKIHEHDDAPPRGFGLFHEGRLVVYYTFEANVSDGWEPPDVHQDSPEKRRRALEMGANILAYALTH